MHFKRASHLTLFALSCFRFSALLPARVVHRYSRIVEPWPLVLTPTERVVRYVNNHRVLTLASAAAVAALTWHLLAGGREERNQVLVGHGQQFAAVAMNVAQLGYGVAYELFDSTVGFAWRWIFDSPDERMRNKAAGAFIRLSGQLEALMPLLEKSIAALGHTEKSHHGGSADQCHGEDQGIPGTQELALGEGMSHAEQNR
jgi:hypothetical protein